MNCGDRTRVTHVYAVKEWITFNDILLEQSDILEDLLVDLYSVVVANGIFTQEVENEVVGRLAGDMLVAQRATADSIRFVIALFITSSQCETVDEIHRGGTLSLQHNLVPEVGCVIGTDAIDVFLRNKSATPQNRLSTVVYLQLTRFLEFIHVALTLDGTTRSQEHVFVVSVDVLDPVGQPSDCLIVHDRLPVTRNIGLRCGYAITDVNRYVLWLHSMLYEG